MPQVVVWQLDRVFGHYGVRFYYSPSDHGPVMRAHIEDVLRLRRKYRLDFGDEFRRYMLRGDGWADASDAELVEVCSPRSVAYGLKLLTETERRRG